jgi:Tfp pilus assembly protein PilP
MIRHTSFLTGFVATVLLAAVPAAALPAVARAATDDLVLNSNGQLKLPPDHAAMEAMAAKGHAALAGVAHGVMPKAVMPHGAMPKGATPGAAMPGDDGADGADSANMADEAAAAVAAAAADPNASWMPDDVDDASKYVYASRTLRDPFALPAEVRAPEVSQEDVPPLERAPLSDFKLVAVVKKGKGTVAMVAGSDGKGYTLHVGTRIGSDGGEVRRIMPDAVIVEQVRADEFGELKKSEIVLGLRPEEVVP